MACKRAIAIAGFGTTIARQISLLAVLVMALQGLHANAEDPIVSKLKNATYQFGKQVVRLKDGYREHPVPGGVAGFTELDTDNIALPNGPVGPGGIAAAVVLRRNQGGNSGVLEIHVIREAKGVLKDVASLAVGGAGVKRMVIENDTVKVTELSYGPDDPRCCPSVEAARTYRVQGAGLVPVLSEQEMDALLAEFENVSSNRGAIKWTLALDPQANRAATQLNDRWMKLNKEMKEIGGRIRRAGLLKVPTFVNKVRARAKMHWEAYSEGVGVYGQSSPSQQRAIMVLNDLSYDLKALIGE